MPWHDAPETRDDITVDRCERCSGFWFDLSELDRWLAQQNADAPGGAEFRIPRRGVGTRTCPRCIASLDTAGWPGLVLDRCSRCHGLFVEASELAEVEGALPDNARVIEERLRAAMVSAGWTLLTAKSIGLLILRFIR